MDGNWTNNGTVNPGTSQIYFNTSTTISGSGTHDFHTIVNYGTLNGPATPLYVSGNWENWGTWNQGAGAVIFDGNTNGTIQGPTSSQMVRSCR